MSADKDTLIAALVAALREIADFSYDAKAASTARRAIAQAEQTAASANSQSTAKDQDR